MQPAVRRFLLSAAAVALLTTAIPSRAGVSSGLSFDLARATIWSNGAKPGRLVARGELPDGSLPVDVSGGLVVTVSDAADFSVTVDFAPGDCKVGSRKTTCQKTIKPTKRQRIKIRNARGGEVRIFFQELDVEGPLTGPVTVEIDGVSDGFIGTSGPCIGGQHLLFCR